MKNKKITTITIITIICTTGVVFANEIKMIQKNNQEYIPLKQLAKNIDKKITLEKDSSFAKVNENITH